MADPDALLAKEPTERKELGYFQGMRYLFHHHDPKLLIMIGLIYFTQGFNNLSLTAAFFYYKESLGNSDESVAQVVIPLLRIAWLVKPLFAFFIDARPICGSNRHPYIILSALIGLVANYALSQSLSLAYFIVAFICGQISQVVADIVADALTVVESRKDEEEGVVFLPTYNFSMNAIAIILEGFGLGMLWRYVDFNPVYSFQMMIAMNALILVSGLLYREAKETQPAEFSKNWRLLMNTLSNPKVYKVLIVISIMFATMPRLSLVMQIFNSSVPPITKYYLRNDLKFSVSFFHMLNGFYGISFLLGGFLYSHYLKRYSVRTVLTIGQIVLVASSSFTFVLVYRETLPMFPTEYYVPAVCVISTTLYVTLVFMPNNLVALRMCAQDLEGTIWACFTSLFNISAYVSEIMGAGLFRATNAEGHGFNHLPIMLVLQVFVALVPLFFLRFIQKDLKTSSDFFS